MKFAAVLTLSLACAGALSSQAASSDKVNRPKNKPSPAAVAQSSGWLEDIDAAFKTARAENKPVFINFTGSDWCPWCILADKHIFARPEWREFSAKVVSLKVDFPQKNRPKSEVMLKRRELANKYKVGGYPTFVLVSAEGKEITRFVAGKKSAQEFIAEVRKVVK
jgi:protein disulfide-isomerase